MQTSRSFIRSFTRTGLRYPTPRTFSSANLSINRSASWWKEHGLTSVTRAKHPKITARPFSTSPAFKQEPNVSPSEVAQTPREDVPSYEMRFTCKKCMTPQTHKISKQGYHHGTVLVTCPGCKNRHLVADHLKIFSDKSITLEDILKEKGQVLKKGTLSADGDLEFWDDGTTTPRAPSTNDTKTEPPRLENDATKS